MVAFHQVYVEVRAQGDVLLRQTEGGVMRCFTACR